MAVGLCQRAAGLQVVEELCLQQQQNFLKVAKHMDVLISDRTGWTFFFVYKMMSHSGQLCVW